jgi:penicillin amidase
VNLRDGVKNHVAPVPPGSSIPAAVLIVPRRNQGPLVQLDLQSGAAISVQYTGFSATRELDAFRLVNRARNLADFTNALQFLDVGSENFIYGDIQGNIGYFSTGEVPLREDLQANTVHGAPPWLLRDGTGGNEWLRLIKPGPIDGTGYQYLPFAELPHVVNPHAGFVVNANNDPAGVTLDNNPLGRLRPGNNGVYYLAFTFDFGSRAGRITELLHNSLMRSAVDRGDMQAIQSDVVLFDAEILTPRILNAFDRAQKSGAPAQLAALAADESVVEAVGRLRAWNYTTPTGVPSGFDPSETPARPSNSVAATIYSVWRSQVVANGLDHTLNDLGVPLPDSDESLKAIRHLIERDGIGESTLDFFSWTGLAWHPPPSVATSSCCKAFRTPSRCCPVQRL